MSPKRFHYNLELKQRSQNIFRKIQKQSNCYKYGVNNISNGCKHDISKYLSEMYLHISYPQTNKNPSILGDVAPGIKKLIFTFCSCLVHRLLFHSTKLVYGKHVHQYLLLIKQAKQLITHGKLEYSVSLSCISWSEECNSIELHSINPCSNCPGNQ